MPRYQYQCLHCGANEEAVSRFGPPAQAPLCACGDRTPGGHSCLMIRDYKGENVGFSGVAEIKKEREGRMADRGDILPTAKDYERPEDPTGEKGMARWMAEHSPRPDNKNPAWPTRSERQGV